MQTALDQADWPLEEGTLGVEVSLFDTDGVTPYTPLTVAWRLTDQNGTVINERDAEALTPAEEVTVVLSGDDLAYDAEVSGARRQLIVYGTYDSETLGNGVPFVHLITFQVIPIKGWPAA